MQANWKKTLKSSKPGFLLSMPYVVFATMFVAYPLIFSFLLVFNRWSIIGPMEWVGLSNFKEMLGDGVFWQAMKNTLVFLVIHVP